MSRRGAAVLITVVLAAGLSGVAQAQSGSQFSWSYDAGLMHSTAVRLLDTRPSGIATGGAGFAAIPCAGISGLWEYEGLVVGARSDLAVELTTPRYEVFLGGLAGYRFGWGNWRVQVAAELGEHLLWRVGGGEYQHTDDSALLPFAGASIDVDHANGVRPGHVGLSAFIRQDLEQRALAPTAVVDDENEDVHFTFQGDYRVGGTAIGLALHLTTN